MSDSSSQEKLYDISVIPAFEVAEKGISEPVSWETRQGHKPLKLVGFPLYESFGFDLFLTKQVLIQFPKKTTLSQQTPKLGMTILVVLIGCPSIVYNRPYFIFCKFSSDYHIISNVARLLTKRFPTHLIVVINSNDNGYNNIYFRRKKIHIDLTKIVDYAHSKKYNAGGKEEVAGVFVPKNKSSNFIRDCLENVLYL